MVLNRPMIGLVPISTQLLESVNSCGQLTNGRGYRALLLVDLDWCDSISTAPHLRMSWYVSHGNAPAPLSTTATAGVIVARDPDSRG